MTPVEERIDHEEAKRIAEILVRDIDAHRAWVPGPGEDKPSGLFFVHEDVEPVLRAYLALLTEHSVLRKEYQAMGREVYRLREALAQSEVDARWVVGQWQRLKDEPVKEVALAIVERCQAALDLPATESVQPEEER